MNAFSLPARPSRIEMQRAHRGVRPADPPRAHASGPAPYRVLAVGGALLAGEGVLTHDLALTGAIARGLARQVGHGVDVTSCIDERGGVEGAVRAIRHRDLSGFDALVLVLDIGQHPADAAESARRAGRLAKVLWPRLTPAASISIVVPPVVGREGADASVAFNEAVERESGALTRVIRLADRVFVPSAAERYAIWGEAIGSTVAESLVDPILWSESVERLDERPRLRAVQRLEPLDEQWELEFRRIITFARQAYGARCASFSIIGEQRTRYLARQGFDIPVVTREETICDVALHTYGGVIVGDASTDDRFQQFPLVVGGAVRFYAGYRVESPDGQPIGVLCVFDSEPRPVLLQDLALLRDFAASAERRIWELQQRDARR